MKSWFKTTATTAILVGVSCGVAHALGGTASDVDNFISSSQAWVIRVLVLGVGTTMAIIQSTKMHGGDPDGLRKLGYSVGGIVIGLFLPTIINILAGFANYHP